MIWYTRILSQRDGVIKRIEEYKLWAGEGRIETIIQFELSLQVNWIGRRVIIQLENGIQFSDLVKESFPAI